MRRIALLTSDFALYHDLVQWVRDHGVAFESLSFGQTPGPQVGVLVTSWRDLLRSDLPKGLPVVAVPLDEGGREDIGSAIHHAQRILEGVKGYHEVAVGVDPGKRPGVAVLGDGRVVHTAQVFAPQDLARLVPSLLGQFPSDRYVIRIGHGAPRERDEILRRLSGLASSEVRIELVDETGTTPGPGRRGRLAPDVAAALEIARTPGRPPSKPKRYVSPGQIREIQRESREFTEGRFTISRDLARRVARGEQTLAEAVEDERQLSRRPRSRSSSP